MGEVWAEYRTRFSHTIRTPEAQKRFAAMRRRWPVLQRFTEPSAAVDFLIDSHSDRGEKDAAFRVLVSEARHGRGAAIAQSVLLLAVWPSLQLTYSRYRPWYREREGELAGEVASQFLRQVQDANLDGIGCVAATFTLNVTRDVGRTAGKSRKMQRREAELPGDDAGATTPPQLTAEPAHAATSDRESMLGVPLSLPPDAQTQALRARLAARLGEDDAQLLVDVAVLDRPLCELAAERGVSDATMRKRYERARDRARNLVEELRSAESRSGTPPGLPQVQSHCLRLVEDGDARPPRRQR
jgi:DNA-directed RNA polymerase specialized sigma24 family protein